ncbi:MAG TPA: nuclear transport factor 2 family protein, partial [Chitinophagaceae bacterium]|nr:nuclear transport factor 2 family protein [Chitinophagaceae bacterium]
MTQQEDLQALSELNASFIQNFISQDVPGHDRILHQDFVCIENSGEIVGRQDYLRDWATAYENSGCSSFRHEDEFIRIFGNVALVRSKTVSTKLIEGVVVEGNTVYTDTYVKENCKWLCVQAQITPVS